MSTVQERQAVTEVTYTICPGLVAAHVAIEQGWVKEELDKLGVGLRYLRSLPKSQWLPHFNHRLDNLFREGGNIPPIWTRSLGLETVALGLETRVKAGQLVARPDSGINTVADLKGKRIGLAKRATEDRVDFGRAGSHRTILLILEDAGLKASDVQIVDVLQPKSDVGDPSWEDLQPASKPSEQWAKSKFHEAIPVEVQALLDGKVDAVVGGRQQKLEKEGKIKAIGGITRRLVDPSIITVNAKLAKEHPEAVVAYLRALIKAGRWVNSNPREAAEIFVKITGFKDPEDLAKRIAKLDFVPNLSEEAVEGLRLEKDFLLEAGYIPQDFDVRGWLDGSFLEAALKG
jgi:ABC-type nitrate/sulfonate/bicarbonate transport system substrate-binding protein